MPRVQRENTAVVLYLRDGAVDEVERLLHAMKARVDRCATGSAAVERVRERSYRCVITPLQLPDMDAYALIGALREIAPGLKAIVILDTPGVSEAVAVMHAGAHAVVDSRLLSTGLYHNVAPLLRDA